MRLRYSRTGCNVKADLQSAIASLSTLDSVSLVVLWQSSNAVLGSHCPLTMSALPSAHATFTACYAQCSPRSHAQLRMKQAATASSRSWKYSHKLQ